MALPTAQVIDSRWVGRLRIYRFAAGVFLLRWRFFCLAVRLRVFFPRVADFFFAVAFFLRFLSGVDWHVTT